MMVSWSYLWIKRIDGNTELCALTLLGILFSCLWTKTANQSVTRQQLSAFRLVDVGEDDSLRCKECGKNVVECGCWWQAGIFTLRPSPHGLQRMDARQTVKISSERQLHGDKCLFWCQGSEVGRGRLAGDHRNATVTQITAGYNQSLRTSIRTHNAAMCDSVTSHPPQHKSSTNAHFHLHFQRMNVPHVDRCAFRASAAPRSLFGCGGRWARATVSHYLKAKIQRGFFFLSGAASLMSHQSSNVREQDEKRKKRGWKKI